MFGGRRTQRHDDEEDVDAHAGEKDEFKETSSSAATSAARTSDKPPPGAALTTAAAAAACAATKDLVAAAADEAEGAGKVEGGSALVVTVPAKKAVVRVRATGPCCCRSE